MESATVSQVLRDFTQNSSCLENFISAQAHLEKPFTECTKRLFDLSSNYPGIQPPTPSDGLTELVTEGLDGEQIWEELELANGPLLKHTVRDVAKLLTSRAGVSLLRTRTTKKKPGETKENDESDKDRLEKGYDGSQDLFADSGDATGSCTDSSDQDSETNFDIEDLELRSKKTKSSEAAVQPRGRSSVVDDRFFKLSEMERFLEAEDAKEERRRHREETRGGDAGEEDQEEDADSESVDLFDDLSMDEESDVEESQEKSARNMHYSDYFESDGGKKLSARKKSVRFEEFDKGDEDGETGDDDDDDSRMMQSRDDDGEEEDDDSDESEAEELADILGGRTNENKSTFEIRQEKLKRKIAALEEANISQKPWQLSGEAKATKRPENSLLEEVVDFEVASKPAPVITEETTQALEEVIRQRILDRAWDDVERKQRRIEEPYDFKKRITLNQEKSKQSLAEIYEQEYLKQSEKEKEEDVNPAHSEIKTMMDALFVKLDALSNFHYMPKPVLPEVKIVKHVPSISMEEVTPVTATDASLLAPEEVQEKSKSELKGDTEKTSTDRKQALRRKKKRQRVRSRERLKKQRAVERLKPGMGNKYSMKGALQRLEQDSKLPSSKTTIVKDDKRGKALKSSKSFFGRLQDEVTSQLRGVKMKKRPPTQPASGKKLKL